MVFLNAFYYLLVCERISLDITVGTIPEAKGGIDFIGYRRGLLIPASLKQLEVLIVDRFVICPQKRVFYQVWFMVLFNLLVFLIYFINKAIENSELLMSSCD